ncbi:MAG: carboxypeptidase regulatory-like domain-containing protein [Thermoanaerobaculia bacterium]|nr:carboxypeptidase regulatory-like domain-containing protein [Thermoanaerobaculia bacterium]
MQSLTIRSQGILLALVLCLTTPTLVLAGTLEGTVVYRGAVPKLPTVDMNADPQCAARHDGTVTSSVLVLGSEANGGRTLGNVLVQITGRLPASPPASGTVVIDQVGCLYEPRLVGVQLGQSLEVRNSDGLMHNVHFLPKQNEEKNLAMPPFLKQVKVDFAKPEPAFPVKCDLHPWMKAWVAVLEHPYFATTGPDGVFRIEGVPAGTYTAAAWHEKLGRVESEVTVPADGSTTVNLVMSR